MNPVVALNGESMCPFKMKQLEVCKRSVTIAIPLLNTVDIYIYIYVYIYIYMTPENNLCDYFPTCSKIF